MKVYYTFGTDSRFPFCGGWVEVEAPTMKEAHAVFRANFPDRELGILNCSDYYTEAQFFGTDMPTAGNRGAYCHRRLRAGVGSRSNHGPASFVGLLRRQRIYQQARRQAAMDQYTLGECLHLYYVLGWTAEIRAGHLLFLGRVPEEETEPAAGRRSAWQYLSAGIKKPGGEKGSAELTCHESTACQKAPCYYSRADRL